MVNGLAGATAVWTHPIQGRTLRVQFNATIDEPLSEGRDAAGVSLVGSPGMAYAIGFRKEKTSYTVGADIAYAVTAAGSIYAGYELRSDAYAGDYTRLGLRLNF